MIQKVAGHHGAITPPNKFNKLSDSDSNNDECFGNLYLAVTSFYMNV